MVKETTNEEINIEVNRKPHISGNSHKQHRRGRN